MTTKIPGMTLLSEREHAALLKAEAERDHLKALAGRASRTAYLIVDENEPEAVRLDVNGSVSMTVRGRVVVYDHDHVARREVDLSGVGVIVTIDAEQARRLAQKAICIIDDSATDSPESTHDYATRRDG